MKRFLFFLALTLSVYGLHGAAKDHTHGTLELAVPKVEAYDVVNDGGSRSNDMLADDADKQCVEHNENARQVGNGTYVILCTYCYYEVWRNLNTQDAKKEKWSTWREHHPRLCKFRDDDRLQEFRRPDDVESTSDDD